MKFFQNSQVNSQCPLRTQVTNTASSPTPAGTSRQESRCALTMPRVAWGVSEHLGSGDSSFRWNMFAMMRELNFFVESLGIMIRVFCVEYA
jgi:hypothetical protein